MITRVVVARARKVSFSLAIWERLQTGPGQHILQRMRDAGIDVDAQMDVFKFFSLFCQEPVYDEMNRQFSLVLKDGRQIGQFSLSSANHFLKCVQEGGGLTEKQAELFRALIDSLPDNGDPEAQFTIKYLMGCVPELMSVKGNLKNYPLLRNGRNPNIRLLLQERNIKSADVLVDLFLKCNGVFSGMPSSFFGRHG
jgi:hypothetical protein